jgi:hypothetical protein
LGKRVKFPASPAFVERTLFGDPDYPHTNQGGGGHPMDPSHSRIKTEKQKNSS